MKPEEIVTLKEVHDAIRGLEDRHNRGEEKEDDYKVKKEALLTAERIVRKGLNGYRGPIMPLPVEEK